MTTGSLTIHIGHDELIIRKRYEVLSIINDILVALWFIVGSVLFFSDATTIAGTWCFLAGSIELLIRPMIRLTRRVHLARIAGPTNAYESSQDF
ncbi:MAG TPA: YrhK family protein [Actinomycetospora sp.]|uniref:YrhK family protein n=1 Tax=Actinomycetospora sp. TaxID=1872135 RepID=UPI002F420A63